MNDKAIYVCVLMVGLASPAFSASDAVPVNDSEGHDVLVNSETNRTGLTMAISISENGLKAGKECEVRVEIKNTSHRIEVVYMPGLSMRPIFKPAKTSLRVDEYGPPMIYGRATAKDDRLNYIVLMGLDSYCRSYRWTPPDIGEVSFGAVYQNQKDGSAIGVKAWAGELRAESIVMKVPPK